MHRCRSLGRNLFDAAPEPKTFISYPTGQHSNLPSKGMPADVIGFLDRVIAPAR